MCADYMTAPQDVIGNDEWNYEYVLQYLSDNPSTDSQGIGKAVCDGYYAKCEEKGTDKDAAMSCVALDNMSTLNQAFDGYGRRYAYRNGQPFKLCQSFKGDKRCTALRRCNG